MIRTIALIALAPAMAVAQQPAAPLKPATASVAAGFRIINSLHELRDGRLLISDVPTGMFGVADFATGKFTSVPGVRPGRITALAGDTSIVLRTGEDWVFFVGGHPGGMLPAGNPVALVATILRGADSIGHVLTLGRLARNDSMPVIRVSRVTAAQDTIAWIRYPKAELTEDYLVREQADLALDGWTAVLRGAPYRVDWRSPDGRWTFGAPIPVPAIKVDAREKQVVMTRRAFGGTVIPSESAMIWSETVPAFTTGTALLSPDGKVLVRRTLSADFPDVRYDVISRRGQFERQVTMGPHEQIIGFGAKSVYVAVTGKDSTQVIQRHPWP